MGVLFTVVLIAVGIVNIFSHIMKGFADGSPAKDRDILELFEKKGEHYSRLEANWAGSLFISDSNWGDLPRIEKNHKWFILYPYTIEGVGVVPRWYKSRKVIDAKFAELFKGSRYDTNKRKKLGLD